MAKNVLVVDSGGRGHSVALKLAQSRNVGKVFVAPGNGGTQKFAENIPLAVTDIAGLLQAADEKKIDFTVASQDDSLAAGIVDAFSALGHRVFGPSLKAMKNTEASKANAKRLMWGAGIPTAPFKIFTNYTAAVQHVHEHGAPIVVKASGLALGKGAYPCKTVEGAVAALNKIMIERVHGDAGNEVVIEEFLPGEEVSIQAFCDGKTFSPFPVSQDHKLALDNNLGDMSGGMGTIARVPWFTAAMTEKVNTSILRPTLDALCRIGSPFTGVLYPGLMVHNGSLNVLELNARPGDPETQSCIRLLKTDLLEIMEACVDGKLADCKVEWNPGFAACIVMASGGYPGPYQKGIPIYGIEEAEKVPGVVVYHAGTIVDNGVLKTSDGRVLGVTAIGDSLWDALEMAYRAVKCIRFEGMHYRKDIGEKSLNYLTQKR